MSSENTMITNQYQIHFNLGVGMNNDAQIIFLKIINQTIEMRLEKRGEQIYGVSIAFEVKDTLEYSYIIKKENAELFETDKIKKSFD